MVEWGMDNHRTFARAIGRSKSSGPEFLGFSLGDTDLAMAKSCIEKGLDYHTPRPGKGPLGEVVHHVNDEGQLKELLSLMLAAGMNPLLAPVEDQRELFKRKISTFIEESLCKLEHQGEGLRDAQGGNFYHAMARHGPLHLLNVLHEVAAFRNADPIEHPLQGERLEWARAKNHWDENLLHVLWNTQTLHTLRGEHQADAGAIKQKVVSKFMESATDTTRVLLLDLGVDPMAESFDGIRPWNLMKEYPWEQMDDIHREVFERVRALDERHSLSENTPGALRRTGGTPRL